MYYLIAVLKLWDWKNVLIQIIVECAKDVYLIGFNQKQNRRKYEES